MTDIKRPGRPPKPRPGRPPTYSDPAEMARKIEEYWQICDEGTTITAPNKRGDIVTYQRKIPYTIPGLALHLGFNSRVSLFDYTKKSEEFANVISRARSIIERDRINGALTGDYNPKVAQFDLTYSHGYQPETVQVTGSLEMVLRRVAGGEPNAHIEPGAPCKDAGKSDG